MEGVQSFLLPEDLGPHKAHSLSQFLWTAGIFVFHRMRTILPFLGASSLEHVGIHHAILTRVTTPRVLNLHVLVLHIGIKRLELAQLKKVRGKQGECLQAV